MRQQLEALLGEAMDCLNREPRVATIDWLARELALIHDRARTEGCLREFKRISQGHPLAKTILLDPYCRRAFEKPRGYPGDAVMLDYIYRPSEITTCNVGAIIHQATTTLPNAKSITWRRNYLGQQLVA